MPAYKTPDKLAAEQLAEALDCVDSYCLNGMVTAGKFGARVIGCPGPYGRFVPMITCRNCRAAQLIRRAMIRMGIPVPEVPAD